MARINGVHHVALSVPSLDEARAFYRDLLGFAEVMAHRWAGSPRMDRLTGLGDGTAARMAFLSAGNLLIELFEYEAPRPLAGDPAPPVNRLGYTHLCLDVDDAPAIHAELAAKGVAFLSDPVESTNACTVYGRDPFGNVIEFQQLLSETVPSPLRGAADPAQAATS